MNKALNTLACVKALHHKGSNSGTIEQTVATACNSIVYFGFQIHHVVELPDALKVFLKPPKTNVLEELYSSNKPGMHFDFTVTSLEEVSSEWKFPLEEFIPGMMFTELPGATDTISLAFCERPDLTWAVVEELMVGARTWAEKHLPPEFVHRALMRQLQYMPWVVKSERSDDHIHLTRNR